MKEGIKGGSAAESTARHLENLILEGSLRPGEPLLPEREMAFGSTCHARRCGRG